MTVELAVTGFAGTELTSSNITSIFLHHLFWDSDKVCKQDADVQCDFSEWLFQSRNEAFQFPSFSCDTFIGRFTNGALVMLRGDT